MIKKEFSLDIESKHILSMSSIAFKIFKSCYKEKYALVYIFHSFIDTYIRKSFFGGRTEIFNNFAKENYYYDVNSLYPYIMKIMDMPIGAPIYRDEDYFKINQDISSFFGFGKM